jgi:hypothetical protein
VIVGALVLGAIAFFVIRMRGGGGGGRGRRGEPLEFEE